MRTLKVRSLSFAALAFLAVTGSAIAQDKSSALLNTLDVQQLVKRAEPGDNARLAAHFTALAERYMRPKPGGTRRWRRASSATQAAISGQA
jgi:hypothetical protein